MKKLISIALAASLMALPLAIIIGCNAPQQRIAFNSLATVQVVTVGAYDGYVDQVIGGVVPTNDMPKVAKQFNSFQSAYRLALDAVEFNTNALAPASLQRLSTDLLNLITTITKK